MYYYTPPDELHAFYFLYKNEDLGLVSYGYGADGYNIFLDKPDLLALFPSKIGDVWIRSGHVWSWSYYYECVAISEQVTVPAGTFNCYVYEGTRISNGELVFIYYYAPNIGLIGYKQYLGESYEGYEIPIEYQCFWVKKLLSYSLN